MSDNTFTRHMGIFATATDLQTAVAEGKLGDPYVARILLDSSVTGYESSGIYIQESESGSPDMTVIDYVEPDSSSGGQATRIPDNFTRVNLESGNTYASFGDFPAETLLNAIDNCCDDSSTYGLYIMDASGNLTAFNDYYREVDHYKGMTMNASVSWMAFDGDLPIPGASPDKLFAEEARYQSTFINTIGKVPVLLYHNSSTGNDEALYDSSTAGLDVAQMAAGLYTGIRRNEQEEPVNTGFTAEAAMWYDFEVNSSTGEVSITPHLAIGDGNQVNGGYNQYYTSSQFRLFAVPYADYIAAFNTNGYFYWKIQDNGGYTIWDVLEWAAGYAKGYPNGYEPLATIADGSTFTFTPANEGFTVDSSMFIIGGTYNPEYPGSQYYQGFYVNGSSISTMRVTPVFTVPEAVIQAPITISDYGVRSMFTSDINKWADLKFTADVELPEGSDGSDIYMAGAPENVRFAFIRKDFFNYACENFDDGLLKSAPNAEQVDNTGKVIGHLLNGDLENCLSNFAEDYPDGFDNISFQPTNYSETSEDTLFESSAILRRAPLPEEIFPYTVYCWSDNDDEFTAPVPLTTLDSSANPNMYTWIIVAGYTMGYDDQGIGYYVSNDGEYCYKLNEFVIPPAQSLIRMTSPITPEYYNDDGYLAERLKFDASANTLIDAYVQETWGDDSTMINVGNSTGIKYMFINESIYFNTKYNETGAERPADDTSARLILSNFLNGAYNGVYEWAVEADASGGFISAVEDSDTNKMWTPDTIDAENNYDMYTYYLIAGYAFDDGEGNDVFYPDYVYPIGTYRQHYYETSDASLLGFSGYIGLETMNVDGNEIEGYNVGIDGIQNTLYAEIGIGIYSKSAFETAYQESGTSDSSIEYLTTFRDNGNMLEYSLTGVGDGEGFNWSESGCSWNLYGNEENLLNDEDLSELIPNYNEGDDLCVAAWWVDSSSNLTDAEFVATTAEEPDEPSDSSTDVSTGYKFVTGQGNEAYFDTGYIPGEDTVVQFKGTIVDDGGIAHGVCGNISTEDEWNYRMFGYEDCVYFDRQTNSSEYRINGQVPGLNTTHEYEFGNYYFKVDSTTVATSQESLSSYESPETPLYVFAGSAYDENNGAHAWGYAAAGTELEYFKILEPDASGNLQLMMDLRPAVDTSSNVCLYDEVSGDVIYPEGSIINITATLIDDSSQGGDSSIDSSFAADGSAYITDYFMLPAGTDMGGWYTENDMYMPSIRYGVTDADANYFQIGYYPAEDLENASIGPGGDYETVEEYYEANLWAMAPTHVNGEYWCTYDSSTQTADGIYALDDGNTYVFIGRFVNYVDELVNDGNMVYQRQEIVEAGPIIEIGRWPEDSSGGDDSSINEYGYYVEDLNSGNANASFDDFGDKIYAAISSYLNNNNDSSYGLFLKDASGNYHIFADMQDDGYGTYSGTLDFTGYDSSLDVSIPILEDVTGWVPVVRYIGYNEDLQADAPYECYDLSTNGLANGSYTNYVYVSYSENNGANSDVYRQAVGVITDSSIDDTEYTYAEFTVSATGDLSAGMGTNNVKIWAVSDTVANEIIGEGGALEGLDIMTHPGIFTNYLANDGSIYERFDCGDASLGTTVDVAPYLDGQMDYFYVFVIPEQYEDYGEGQGQWLLTGIEYPAVDYFYWDGNSSAANPAVEYDNYSDDGAGTITFDAWLNDDAIAAGADHYSVGITSDAMMQTAMENAMMNSEEFDPDAWMIAQCSGTYTGDSAAPNSITLSYSTSFDDQGQIIAVMYDSGDNIIQNYNGSDYTTIDGWSYSVSPEEFPPEEPPIEPPME